MKIFAKKTVAMLLLFAMLVTALPTSVFAAHRPADGYPTNLADNVILSVNTATVFPGEPTTHLVTSNYVSFNSSFNTASWFSSYNSRASNVLKTNILDDVKQGTTVVDGDDTYYVWGIFNTSSGVAADVFANYFVDGTSNPIFNETNQAKMISKALGISTTQAAEYEIVWYVVKFQTSDTAWHIDGIIRERDKYSVNYYGNSNTGGTAPTGTNSLSLNDKYTVLGNTGSLEREMAGVPYEFAGWNTKADGTGTTYQAGDVVDVNTTNFPDRILTLYAKWVTKGNYKATAKLYVDDELTNIEDIHPNVYELMISHNGTDFTDLSKDSTGVYSATIYANGNYSFYHHEGVDELHKIGTYTIPIYNQNGTLEIKHWSVNYHSDGGFDNDSAHRSVHYAGTVTNVVAEAPEREGYIFRGWNTKADGNGTTYQPGAALPALTARVDLYAQYEATTTARVNVTLNHGHNVYEGNDEISFELVSRGGAGQSYSRVENTFITLPQDMGSKFDKTEGVDANGDPTTVYTATADTYTELPANAEYSVAISKKNYNVDSVTATKNPETGEWVIDVELTFDPLSHELEFGVRMQDEDPGVIPFAYYPQAVVAKVYFWDVDTNSWRVIQQHKEGIPGVRVDIDNTTPSGHTASYPVWGVDGDGTPYGYRFVITGFIHQDGTTHAATPVAGSELIQWTDGTYTATLDADLPFTNFEENGLEGAYFDGAGNQQGNLTALITMDLYNVTFHANAEGATVEGKKEFTMEYQYEMPDLEDFPPNHADDNYVFGGWYLEPECINKAVSGTDLTEDVHLYAKWKAPLTIRGEVKANGTYMLDGNPVEIKPADRITSAEVVLEVVGTLGSAAQQEVLFTDYSAGYATAEYSFTVPDDGTEYEVMTRVLNYTTGYDNEPIEGTYVVMNDTTDLENPANDAIRNGDDEAVVNIELKFAPDSFDQRVVVEADEIGDGFRPTDAVAVIRYRNLGDTHFPNVISQHATENGGTGGIEIVLNEDLNSNSAAAEGDGEESIWEYHYSGTIYEYHIGIDKLFGDVEDAYNADGSIVEDPPYHAVHSDATSWSIREDKLVGGENGVLVARLYPNDYDVEFDLNTEDTVTNMESFLQDDGRYMMTYLWSYGETVTAAPEREHYSFNGWFEDLDGDKAKGDSEDYVRAIDAAEHRDITLTADWQIDTFTVTWADEDGDVLDVETYEYNQTPSYKGENPEKADTAQYDYTFSGWTPAIVPVTEDMTYTATYSKTTNKYTVTWVDEDGSFLADEEYDYGATPTYKGETPDKEDTLTTDYTFSGWSPAIVTVTEDATYKAQYSESAILYTVTWVDENGTSVLAEEEYAYGETPVYPNADPEKQDTAQYNYEFSGWTPDIVPVTEDATYKAQYSATLNSYTVTWLNDDGAPLLEEEYEYGETPVYPDDDPEKTDTAQYDYTFSGWTPDIVMVTEDATYTATYTSNTNTYTVTYTDGVDGEEVFANEVHSGIAYGAATPAFQTSVNRPGYNLIGWTPTVDATVTGNATYVAVWEEIEYTVTWVDEDNAPLATETYLYNETPVYPNANPEKQDTAQYDYTFSGWTPDIVPVTANATYKAQYSATLNSYTVKWLNDDGALLLEEEYEYGETPVYPNADPEKQDTAQYDYEFDGWTPAIVMVTEDATYTATYTSTLNSYTVKWLGDDGALLLEEEYEYGETPVYPNADPEKQDTAQYNYEFSGWTPNIVMVTEDATYTATYTSTLNSYTVTWLNDDGTLLLEEEYEYGETPVYPNANPTKAATAYHTYTFKGWNPAIVEVTEDATYTAQYTAVGISVSRDPSQNPNTGVRCLIRGR